MTIRSIQIERPDPTAPRVTAGEVLRAAHDRLAADPAAWAKGDFFVDAGECALGAIVKGSEGKTIAVTDYWRLTRALLDALKEIHPELEAETIPEINDDPSVTYEDILVAFRSAALKLDDYQPSEVDLWATK